MKFTRLALIFSLLGTALLAQDRDLSSFGSAPAEEKPQPKTAAKPNGEPRVTSKADLLTPPPLLPARTFAAGNGYAKIQSRGRGLDFTFNDARFADAVTEISKTFDCVVSYAGDPDRRIIGRYSNIRSAGQLLSLITDMTDLVVVVTQRGFIIQQLDSARLQTVKLDEVALGVGN